MSSPGVPRAFHGHSLRRLRKISALEPEEESDLRAPAPSPEFAAAPVVPDAVDHAMLEALRVDGRATRTDLQRVTGLSETAVRKRLDRPRATGVPHIAVEYDHEPLGQGVEALVWLTVAPHQLAGAGRALAARPEARFAAAVTGRTDLVCSVLPDTSRSTRLPHRAGRRAVRCPGGADGAPSCAGSRP
ncbi:Lrp/AsnC family transcriptional regulator [Streptomyces sp. HO565]|uniref:Lrp/AsnC family transcriptional regulator n=1 Tax=Streptomyces sp. HO565 TaxID=2857489 RepID=UPI0038B44E8D